MTEFNEITATALKEPTLAEALAFVAVWEMERIVKRVKEHPAEPYESCFRYCFAIILEKYDTEK